MRRVTCLISEDKHLFLSDSCLILQNLDLQDPVLQYVISVCTAFHKEYGFGLKSLLYLITEMYKLSSSLHRQGIPVGQIQEHLEAGLKICEEVTKEIEIQIVECKPENQIQPSFVTKETLKGSNSSSVTKETLKGSNSCTNELLPDGFKSSENLLHLTGIKTDISTDDGYIPAVKLRMSTLKTEEEEEDLEDVSWFFLDDTPQGTSQIEDLAGISHTQRGGSGYDVDVDDVVLNPMQVTSLKSGECADKDDDEFEECFDDIPRVIKSNTFQTNACDVDPQTFQRTGLSIGSQTFQRARPLINSQILQRTGVSIPATQDTVRQEVTHNQYPEEEDFDQCFCDRERDSKKQKDFCPKAIQNMDEKAQKNPKMLEKLLKNLSTVRSSHDKIRNNSRHFKTIESTVQELSGGKALGESQDLAVDDTEPEEQSYITASAPPAAAEHINTQTTSIEKVNNLISKLKIKSSSSQILSRSRHYRASDSTEAEEKEHENFHSNYGEVVSSRQLLDSTEDDVRVKDKNVDISDGSPENQSIIRGIGYQSIAKGLSHGCEDVMDTVLKVAIRQTPKEETLKLNVSHVYIITTPVRLLHDNPAIVEGTVIQVSTDIIANIVHSGDRLLRTVVINGDVTPTFCHKGYRSTLDRVTTTSTLQQYTDRSHDSWTGEVTQFLQLYQIDAVLASGRISPDLQEQLPHLALVQNVPFSALQCICAASDIAMATYITDICQFHISPGFVMKPLHDDWSCRDIEEHYVTVTHPHSQVQSVVYSHPAQLGRDCFQQEFWRCTQSLSRALKTGTVLPGGGQTEDQCAVTLLSRSDLLESGTKSLVMRELAQVLCNYGNYVCGHSSITQLVRFLSLALEERQSHPQSSQGPSSRLYTKTESGCSQDLQFYDEGTAKLATWTAAMKTALVLLQIDSCIVTGIDSLNKI